MTQKRCEEALLAAIASEAVQVSGVYCVTVCDCCVCTYCVLGCIVFVFGLMAFVLCVFVLCVCVCVCVFRLGN